jgi:hypothetical protein
MIQFSAGHTVHFHRRWVKFSACKLSPHPRIGRTPHQTDLFLIPLENAQVNPDRSHTACHSSGVMHSARQPVARRRKLESK